jgi:hypothetical protein
MMTKMTLQSSPLNPTTPAPSNLITKYCVDVTSSSDLGKINHRIIITRWTLDCEPFVFEMLLTDEQFVVWRQLFNPY